MSSFEDLINQSIRQSDTNQNNNEDQERREPVHPVLVHSDFKSGSGLRFRPVPYLGSKMNVAGGHMMKRVFASLNKSDGSSFTFPLDFDPEDTEDKLYTVLNQIININKNSGQDQDVIAIRTPSKFPTRLSDVYNMHVIRENMQTGEWETNKQTNMPEIATLQLNKTAYNSYLTNAVKPNMPYKDSQGNPIQVVDERHAGVITESETKTARLYKTGTKNADPYAVEVRGDIVEQALPQGYDAQGNFDDPAYYFAPTKEVAPNIYDMALKQFTAKLNTYNSQQGAQPYTAPSNNGNFQNNSNNGMSTNNTQQTTQPFNGQAPMGGAQFSQPAQQPQQTTQPQQSNKSNMGGVENQPTQQFGGQAPVGGNNSSMTTTPHNGEEVNVDDLIGGLDDGDMPDFGDIQDPFSGQ